MRRPGSTRAAAAALLVTLATACSNGGGEPPITSGDGATDALHAEVASYDLAVGGEGRFIVGLFMSDDRFVSFGDVQLDFSHLGRDAAEGEPRPGPSTIARFLPVPGSPPVAADRPRAVPASQGRGVYAATVGFDEPGIWQVEVTADIEGTGSSTATAAFTVLERHAVPAPGDMAPRTDNLTVRSRAPAAAIDSRAAAGGVPDPELHRETVASSIEEGVPAVVVISTPVYCVSRFCGPITDMVQRLATDHSDRTNFIHIEVWRDYDANTINRAAADWIYRNGDLREPWVFFVGADGRIAARWDNVATRAEIEPFLEDLPRL